MKALLTTAPPCKLEAGQLRRVPQNRSSWPIGYHVCCPACGYVTLVVQGQNDLSIEEGVDGTVTFTRPIRCHFCQAQIRIHRCELSLESNGHAQR